MEEVQEYRSIGWSTGVQEGGSTGVQNGTGGEIAAAAEWHRQPVPGVLLV